MRNKQQNNEGFASISKGGVLYREGELPVLSKDQIDLARIVNQLPHDFPIVNWESMNTKQQLHAMKFSGLNEKEQWSLLNSSVPLIVLDQHNQVQNRIEIAALAARTRTTPGKSTNSTSLQTTAQQRKLDMKQEEYETRFYEKQAGRARVVNTPNDSTKTPDGEKPIVDSRDAMEQKKDKIWDKIESTYNPREAMDRKKDEMWGRVNGTPLTYPAKPSATPLPQPGPTPIATPEVSDNNPQSMKAAPIDLSFRDKQMLLGLLNVDKSLLSVSDQKRVEFIERQVQNGKVTLDQLNRFYEDLLPIRQKAEKTEWINGQKSASEKSATWGSELITNQNDYTSVPGSFGTKGNMKDNACGYMAINNANQFLGYHTDYGDTSYHLNNRSEFTTIADGQLGMNPLIIGEYYRSLGCQVQCYSDANSIPKTYDAYIMLYFYKSEGKNGKDTLMAHYIAADYNPNTDKFTAYNNNNYGTIEQKELLSRFLPKDQCGYFVWGINKLDQQQDTNPASNGRNVRY